MSTAIEKFNFHGDELEIVRTEEGRVAVSIRRVCAALGIDPDSQRKKLAGKPWAVTVMSTATGPDGKKYDVVCLDLESLPMWLGTIEPSRVAEGVRAKLERYQVEAARVLADHFLGRRGVTTQVAAPLAAAATVEALVSQQLAEQLAGFKSAILGEIRATLQARAVADTCTIGSARATHLIKAPLAEIAALRSSIHTARRAMKREGPRAHAQLRAELGFFGEGRAWDLLPEALLGVARVKLAEMRRAALRDVSAAALGRQLELVHPLPRLEGVSAPSPTPRA